MADTKPKAAGIADLLNYKADNYFSDQEIALVQKCFADPRIFKVLRKALIPSILDPELPIEQFGEDAFGSGFTFEQIPDEHIKSIVLGRQDAIKFIVGGLIRLKVIASAPPAPTPEQVQEKKGKDSTK